MREYYRERVSHLNLFVRVAILVTTIIATSLLFKEIDINDIATWLDSEPRRSVLNTGVLFISIGTLVTAIGVPRQLVCFLGGYAFGFIVGTLLALLASVGGSIVCFAYARLLGRMVVLLHFHNRISQIDTFLQSESFFAILIIRLLPIGSNLLTNLAAGLSGVKIVTFIASSVLGYIPQTVIFALLGSGTKINHVFSISLGISLFLLLAIAAVWIFRYHGYPKVTNKFILLARK